MKSPVIVAISTLYVLSIPSFSVKIVKLTSPFLMIVEVVETEP